MRESKMAKETFTYKNMVQQLEQISKDMCEKFGFDEVWFAQKLGRRLSYLAGWGKETFTNACKMKVDSKLYIFIKAKKPIKLAEVKNYLTQRMK